MLGAWLHLLQPRLSSANAEGVFVCPDFCDTYGVIQLMIQLYHHFIPRDSGYCDSVEHDICCNL